MPIPAMTRSPWRDRFQRAHFTFPRWAADNPQRLLYSSPQSGSWQLFVRDLGSGRERQVTATPAGTTSGHIDPAGRWIWWLEDTLGDEFGIWRRVPFSGGKSEPCTAEAAYNAGLALGRRVTVIGENRARGTTLHAVFADGAAAVLYQHPAVARLAGLSSSESLVCIEYLGHHDGRDPVLTVVDVAGQHLCDLPGRPGSSLQAGPWSPWPGDDRLVVHHERAGALRPAIWAPRTGGWTSIDLDLDGEVHASWYPRGDRLLLHQRWHGRSRLHRYDLSAGTRTALPFAPGNIDDAAVRPDGAVWALHSSADRIPGLLTDSGDQVWSAPGTGLPGVRYRDVWVGGVHCFVAEPDTPRPHPTIFILHGGPARHDSDSYCPRVQGWVDHGFAVVLVNYRGSTGYGRRWRNALQSEPGPGLTELADLAAVRSYLIDAGIARHDLVVLEGGSWGGYLTLLALGLQPELWQAGIAVVPVADWAATYADELPAAQAEDRALFGGTPVERAEYYAGRSPITYAENVRAPLMIVAGIHDPHCPKRQIDNYVKALESHSKVYELREFNGGHGSLDIAEQISQHAQQVTFLHRYLGTADVLGLRPVRFPPRRRGRLH